MAQPDRTYKKHETDPDRFEAGQENAHDLLDSKDGRSLANNLAACEKVSMVSTVSVST